MEYFGLGMPVSRLPISGIIPSRGNPSTATLNLSSEIDSLELLLSRFNNKSDDGHAREIVLPEGVDTSNPITVKVDWVPLTANTGDVEISLTILADITPGTNVNAGTLTPVSGDYSVITTVSGESGILKRNEYTVPIPNSLAGDTILIEIARDATNGNTNDTLNGNIAIFDTVVNAVVYH